MIEPVRIFKLNLNDHVKVKLTDVGKDIYYHRFDGLIERGVNLERSYPRVDENGFSSFQLWSFMELYGPHIGITKPNVVEDINLYINESDLMPYEEKEEADD